MSTPASALTPAPLPLAHQQLTHSHPPLTHTHTTHTTNIHTHTGERADTRATDSSVGRECLLEIRGCRACACVCVRARAGVCGNIEDGTHVYVSQPSRARASSVPPLPLVCLCLSGAQLPPEAALHQRSTAALPPHKLLIPPLPQDVHLLTPQDCLCMCVCVSVCLCVSVCGRCVFLTCA